MTSGSGECASNGEPVPSSVDCIDLSQALFDAERTPCTVPSEALQTELLILNSTAPTFFTPGDFVSAELGTCEFAVINELATKIEYCADDLVRSSSYNLIQRMFADLLYPYRLALPSVLLTIVPQRDLMPEYVWLRTILSLLSKSSSVVSYSNI